MSVNLAMYCRIDNDSSFNLLKKLNPRRGKINIEVPKKNNIK